MMGTTVSHDKILAKLGSVGMGITCEACDTRRDCPAALNSASRQTTLRFLEKEYPHE
jgi:hypothetical protein